MRKLLVGPLLALLVASEGAGQSAPSATAETRWEPWIGCWELVDESVRGRSELAAETRVDPSAAARPRRNVAGTRVCVSRAGAGVTLTTLVGSQAVLEDSIIADGRSWPMVDAECRGNKRSDWSADGTRVYTAAEIACVDQAARKVSSVTMMTSGPRWIDVQVIDIGGRKSVRIRRYEPADGKPPARTATAVTSSAWTVADVKEASARLMPETVQAALVELEARFDLKGRQLIELDDAGVPDSVIDLMVALSYPDKFIVEHPVSAGPLPYGDGYGFGYPYDRFDPYGGWWRYADNLFWPSYYAPFAYRYWGFYDPMFVPGSGYAIIASPANANSEPVASGRGRVVDGRGYTRITTRTPEPVTSSGGGTATTSSAGGSSSGASSGGSSGVSSGGYSSGGGGGGGRTAVPRPPG